MQSIFTVALPLLATVTTSTATLPFSSYKLQGPPPPVETKPYTIIKEFEPEKTAILEVAPPPKPKEKRLICKGCNEFENDTLAFFQERGIKDRNALATIMGNIKQESMFVPNICEGGSRTSWNNCYGGYGLIQWTSANRYYINRYMDYAYSWIGWGIHGARTSYAHEYASKLITVEV